MEVYDKLWQEETKHVAEWANQEELAKEYFLKGCRALDDWHDEQLAMSKDYQEELNQNNELGRGEG